MEFYNFIYLENKKIVIDKFFLVIIIFVIAFVLFAFWKWFKGSISLRDKQLSMLGLMIIFLFGLYHFENYRANNNREKVYKNSASVIKKLAEKFKVGENEIFINTPEITEHTVYKIRDKFYQIHWVDNNILVEQMTVPYVDEIKTFKRIVIFLFFKMKDNKECEMLYFVFYNSCCDKIYNWIFCFFSFFEFKRTKPAGTDFNRRSDR